MAAAEAAHRSVWSREDLRALHSSLVAAGAIPKTATLSSLLTALIENGKLREVELQPVNHSGGGDDTQHRVAKRRLIWGTASAFDVALSLRPRSYLSHGSAAVVLGLNTGRDTRVYVNQEQSPKTAPAGRLEQPAIDRAFSNNCRTSTYSFQYEDVEIVLLSGKNTGDYGVIDIPFLGEAELRVTGVARTLVDIAVRPIYAGGPASVMAAFRTAVQRSISDVRMLTTLVAEITSALEALGHIYPYHQAVGFYLERAGVASEVSRPLHDRGIAFDFYIDYAIEKRAYDPYWRVYYPRDLD